jgi:hypothetical protein
VRVRWTWTDGGPRGRRPEVVVHLVGRRPVTSDGDEMLVEEAP